MHFIWKKIIVVVKNLYIAFQSVKAKNLWKHNNIYMMNKIALEIFVDRQNEKWPWAFEHILIILHKILEKSKTGIFWKTTYTRPSFSFEIAKIWNKIRFFVVCETEYENFLKNQIYAHYPNIEIKNTQDYLEAIPNDKIVYSHVELEKHYLYPIKNFVELQESSSRETIDPYSSLTSALSRIGNNSVNMFQINFSPYPDEYWKEDAERIMKILESKLPITIQKILINYNLSFFKIFLFPFYLIIKIISLLLPKHEDEHHDEKHHDILSEDTKNKLTHYGYGVTLNVISASDDMVQNKLNIKEIVSTLWVYSFPGQNGFELKEMANDIAGIEKIKSRENTDDFILSTKELSGLVHLPTTYVKTPNINWVLSRNFEPPSNLPILTGDLEKDADLTPIGKTNFRGEEIEFGIGSNDRRRHMYIIGKTWMGKSTLLENMIIDDIRKGRWVAVIDPHGDLAEAVIGNIPKSRTNATIIFDPSDKDWPIAFNMLDGVSKEHRPLIASGLVWIFKKIFGDSWGPRLEHTLRNTILALLEYPNTTLISIPLMLTSEVYRNKVVAKITDPVVKWFWTNEFAKMAPNQKVETAGPILNKVWQFLSSSILRNILGQPKNSFNMRWAMDNQKIIIINLSKWKIWEDASALLWAMMVTKFQMDAMSRADIAEKERKDFYLYVDEFQNFATDSFATILSEARKYKLNLVMANQYIDQMTESVKGAVFGNVWSLVSFQVWYHDSTIMKEIFWNDVNSEDLTNLKKYTIYTKQLIDWMPSKVFSSDTFSPYPITAEAFETRYKKILQVSREKYSTAKDTVEQKIYKSIKDLEEEELKLEKMKEKFKEEKKKEKEQQKEKEQKK